MGFISVLLSGICTISFTHHVSRRRVALQEMQGQVFVFVVAGYETTSTTLGFFSHYMALYPEVQQRLRDEVDEYFP